MFKKKLKNPVMTVRPPIEINKEYSEVIFKLGQLQVELSNMDKAQERMSTRHHEIADKKNELLERVDELSFEMDEAQKNEAKKKQQVVGAKDPAQVTQ